VTQRFFRQVPVRVVIVLICAIWTLPSVGMLISSFRSANQIRTTGWWTALVHPFETSQWTLENYATVLSADGMANAFANSLIITIPATVIPITLAAFAAYAFAWMRFPGRDLLFAVVVGLLVVPLQMALIPILRLYTNLGLNGTFLGTWLAHTGFGLPLAVYLLYNYISQLPRELFESAWIDGASHYTAFTRLVLPLSVPAIASFAIFQFLWVWNDLLVALVFLGTNPDVAIVTARLTAMVGTKGEAWHLLTAGAFITMIVPLIVFFSLQRYFVRGLLAGSVKG
jgi:alpha-glucoside transport system permease protein